MQRNGNHKHIRRRFFSKSADSFRQESAQPWGGGIKAVVFERVNGFLYLALISTVGNSLHKWGRCETACPAVRFTFRRQAVLRRIDRVAAAYAHRAGAG